MTHGGEYQPYVRYSPLFFKPSNPRHDFTWEGRFGNYVEEILYEFREDKYWWVGHIDESGTPKFELKTVGHPDPNQPVIYLDEDKKFKILRTHYGEHDHRIMTVFKSTKGELVKQQYDPVPNDAPAHVVLIEKDAQSADAIETYKPKEITVTQGSVVIWINQDDVAHTVFSGIKKDEQGELWKSPFIRSRGRFMKMFDKIGTFDYSCIAHPWMHGKVIVIPKSNGSKPEPKPVLKVTTKIKKNLVLMSVKNNGEVPVYGLKISCSEGSIRSVSAKSWNRQKIDSDTVIIQADDDPINKDESLLISLLLENKNSELHWTAFDINGTDISSGTSVPKS